MSTPIIVTTTEQLESIVTKVITETFPKQERVPAKKKLLTAKEVGTEYGLPERTLERWRGEGIGPTYTTVGRRIYYEREVFEAFIKAGRVQTTGKGD